MVLFSVTLNTQITSFLLLRPSAIFVTSGFREFRFGTSVDHNKSQPTRNKAHPTGRGHGRVTRFEFWDSNHISETAKAKVVEFCMQVRYIKR